MRAMHRAAAAAAAATAPLLYAPIDRQVCVPTVTDDGAGPSFCVDFVREDLFDAAERFCATRRMFAAATRRARWLMQRDENSKGKVMKPSRPCGNASWNSCPKRKTRGLL